MMRAWLAIFVVVVVGCEPASVEPVETEYMSELYSDSDSWICHPDQTDDICSDNLDSTVVSVGGETAVELHEAVPVPEFDCFYVYPTASLDLGGNSDLLIGEEEIFTVQNQAARFNRACRVFAPAYRQITVTAMLSGATNSDLELPYTDVEDAWRHYLAQHNEGRGVVLIGHSQGAGVLTRLLVEEIEPDDVLADQLIGAYLIGSSGVRVPMGETIGGTFSRFPLCELGVADYGCIVAYLSFSSDDPPNEDLVYGTALAGEEIACVNPSSLLPSSGFYQNYFPTSTPGVLATFLSDGVVAWDEPDEHEDFETAYFSMVDWISGTCKRWESFDYLEIEVVSDPDDPRSDRSGGSFLPGWGLHLMDVNLAIGDLISLAEQQHAAWSER